MRRALLAATCVAVLGVAGTACADSNDDSGAVTKVEELGPQVAKLRLEVNQLRNEVRSLREELAQVTPSTDPDTGLPLEEDPASTTTTTTPVQ